MLERLHPIEGCLLSELGGREPDTICPLCPGAAVPNVPIWYTLDDPRRTLKRDLNITVSVSKSPLVSLASNKLISFLQYINV